MRIYLLICKNNKEKVIRLMATIELDIDYNYLPELPTLSEMYNLQHNVIEDIGPAGGNPFISLSGSINDINFFLSNEYGSNSTYEDFKRH